MLKNILFFCLLTIGLTVMFIAMQAVLLRLMHTSVLNISLVCCVLIGGMALLVFSLAYDLRFFAKVMTFIAYFSSFLVFSLLAPVFIDRSVTYQMIIRCAENGTLSKNDIEDILWTDIYREQRIKDITEAGFAVVQDGDLKSTPKAEKFTWVMLQLMRIYGLDQTYNEVKNHLDVSTKKRRPL
jgi:hypothetical protein